jgi:hypothetical protein
VMVEVCNHSSAEVGRYIRDEVIRENI